MGTVVVAPLSALAAWAVIRLLGIELTVSAGDGTAGPADVAFAALAGALGGWIAVRLLERHSRHPRAWWGFLSTTALSASTIGPTWLAHGASGVALVALHFVVAIVVIGGLLGTLPVCECAKTQRVARVAPADPTR